MVRAVLFGFIAIALSGCDAFPQAWSRDDIEGIARDAAEDAVDGRPQGSSEDLAATVARLEAQVRRLEDEQRKDIEMLRRITSADATDGPWTEEAFDRLFKNDETGRQNVNWLLERQGRQAIPRAD